MDVLMESIELKGTGNLDLITMKLDMALATRLSQSLSEKVINHTSKMKALLEDGQIQWPGRLEGIIPNIEYRPDTKYISKQLLIEQGSEALDKVLEKNPEVKGVLDALLGSPKEDSLQKEDSENLGEQETAPVSNEELINNVLDKIF
jgi:hypothetical protein